MLVAQNEQGQSVCLVENQAVVGQKFFCPGCGSPVRLRKGQVIRSHFAHVSLKNCQYFSENESAQHLQLKTGLYQWALKHSEAELEKRLPEIEQIADILIGKKLALEVQCSSLAMERLQERTRSYQQAGYQVLWLLGEDLWLKTRLTNLQKQFLYFSKYVGFFLWELDARSQKLRLRYLIHEDLHGRVQCLSKAFPLGVGNLLALLRFPYRRQRELVFKGKHDTRLQDYIARKLRYQSPKWMAVQAQLYQEGRNLLTQSLDDFYPQIRPPQSRAGFVQVQQDVTDYYANFQTYYQQLARKDEQYLYPPIFYQTILKKNLI
ncbi:competence protein CoiA [Streptococcus cuniculi]|uniref:Competence protein CoiA n=1 Tax=Streptococcus cuniculi TaxID=1432788 RepID=A0A4Y9JD03_9STRE|nr:competence protein CoiA family protein [Streptococcus cuniculi]MBF0778052.1 competence protein CoiA [Streptococcus cuniculi]TFU98058.1 competence protein CoiA [Streptococcus cuniculi]